MVRLGAVLGVAAALGIPADVLDGERDAVVGSETCDLSLRVLGRSPRRAVTA